MKTINFEALLGQKGNLYFSNELNCFQLGTVKFEVLEDENDGYRSAMGEVCVLNESEKLTYLLETVTICNSSNYDDGYSLIDGSGHVWVEFGTDRVDDYYPCFRFETNPKHVYENSLIEKIQA